MKGQPAKRQEMLEQIADHVLSVGLTGLSLRPLAAAIGTSDRMLLYYFADKNELITETVIHVSNRLMVRLQSELFQPEPYEALLPKIHALLIQADYRPFMRIWFELVALAARNEEPFKTISCQIMDAFLEWVSAHLVVESEADRPARAALLLGTIEGFLLLNYVGRGNIPATALTGSHFGPDASAQT
jgi:AcrR family transcriptional regulator